MTLARGAGISYGMALERWPEAEDMAIEFAYNILENEERAAACNQCGVDPADVLDERGRRLEEPKYKLELAGCYVCDELARLNKDLHDDEQAGSARWTVQPRRHGEPWIDDGQGAG